MKGIISEIRQCTVCLPFLEHGVNPVMTAHQDSRVVIIGQAPGNIVHKTSIPWDDKSGVRLREWLGVDTDTFYNPKNFALLPMSFCCPGKGKSGDLAPRKECAPLWHNKVLAKMKKLELKILIGVYAQKKYLVDRNKKTLTNTVKAYKSFLPEFIVLPHPSPRNNIWIKKNTWFESNLIPELRLIINNIFT